MRSFPSFKFPAVKSETVKPSQPGGAAFMKTMFGIDPAEIMSAAQDIARLVQGFDARLARIEERLTEIEIGQSRMSDHYFPRHAGDNNRKLDAGSDGADPGSRDGSGPGDIRGSGDADRAARTIIRQDASGFRSVGRED